MNRYEKYKDSGIAWIGEIPEHWEMIKMRFLSRFKTGDKDTVDREDDGQYPFYVRSPKIERINSYSFDGEAVLMAGDGVGAGKVLHYVNGKFDYHQRVYNFHNIKCIKPYLLYLYMQSFFSHKIDEGGAKNTVDSVRLPMIKDFSICIPDKQEQQQIMEYLDWKCGEVDKVVAVREEQIKLLGELRTSIISRAVTKGLNPDAPLKDSGISWIGEIPQHWEVIDLKFVFNYVVGFTPDTKKDEYYLDGTENWVTIADLDSKYVSNSKTKLSEVAISTYRKPIVRKGALMYSFKLSVGKVAFADIDTYTNEAIFSIQPEDKQDLRFYYYSLPLVLIHNANENIYGAPIMNQELIKNSAVRKPPLIEQQAIADYLDKKTAEIDNTITKYKEQIDKLKEYRQALITEVVTGKIDVRDVVVPKTN